MRNGVLRSDRRRLIRTAAAVAFAALGAGCSADVARFDDGFYTGAVPQKPTPQGSVGGVPSRSYSGSLDETSTGSVTGARQPLYRGAAASDIAAPDTMRSYPAGGVREGTVQRSMLAPPSDAGLPPASAPPAYASPVRQMPEQNSVSSAAPALARAATAPTKAGWSDTGNTITLRRGETLEAISSRYGVPMKALVAANGLSSADAVAPGQSLVIPTYSYGASSSRTAAPAATQTAAAPQTLGAPPRTLRAPTAAVAGATPGRVTVEPGDTLTRIARRSGVSVAEMRAANDMSSDTVRVGQTLKLPGGAIEPRRVASLDPKAGSALAKPAAAPAVMRQPKPYQAPQAAAAKPAGSEASAVATTPKVVEVEPKIEPVVANEIAAPVQAVEPVKPATTVEAEEATQNAAAPAATGIDQFRWPVQGRVIKRFGEKDGARRSDGLNISVPRGTPVKAAENGVVIYAGDGLKEFGNTVLVRHDNGLVTVYGHADDLRVKRGETVKRGQEIATAGMTGDAASPMLHFEVRKNSAPVDPGKYLQ